VNDLRALPVAALRFNAVVAGLVFFLALGFGGWVVVDAATRSHSVRQAIGGTLVGLGAALQLIAVGTSWRDRTPFQLGRGFALGLALFGLGATLAAPS
jgi:hypothetical protein